MSQKSLVEKFKNMSKLEKIKFKNQLNKIINAYRKYKKKKSNNNISIYK